MNLPRALSGRSSVVASDQILSQVRAYWGFDTLRPLQEQAIHALLQRRDSLVVLPTGGGKSLCYQVPPLLAAKTVVVVSPLISLMKDQVDGLRECGYPAAAIHSGLTEDERRETARELRAGRLRLLYVSPERLLTSRFLDELKRMGIRSFAIDEAHCISHWGHDFRPEYRKIAVLREHFPDASLHAFTATATQRVREDICAQLLLRNPLVLVGTFDRPNLIYRVLPRDDVYEQTISVLRRHPGEGAIVYCLSRKDTETMAEELRVAGIQARAYHAGLSADERRRTQDAFAAETLNVVTATVAFGMGIDRSNVRCVVHATMPKSIEHYQQETGRAGRDGLPAECVQLYSAVDVMRWERLVARSAQEADKPEEIIGAQMALLEQMRRYCATPQCRHRALSEHFGQEYTLPDCQACDVCLQETEGLEDATELAQKILSCVARIERLGRARYGVTHVADVLLGADTESIRRAGHDRLSTYGLLRGMPKKSLTNRIYQLVDQGVLNRTPGEHPVLQVNEASWEVMHGTRPVRLIRAADKPVKAEGWGSAFDSDVDQGLFDRLRALRFELAQQSGVPAYVVFSDRTLRDLAVRRPTRTVAFREIHGVGDRKAAQYASRFAGEIQAYCAANGMKTDIGIASTAIDDSAPNISAGRERRQRGRVSRTKESAFLMFAEGASQAEVGIALARAPSTIAQYLSEFIERTRPASIAGWVPDATYEAVARAAGELGVDRLRPIYERLQQRVPYDDIRLVVTHLAVRNDQAQVP